MVLYLIVFILQLLHTIYLHHERVPIRREARSSPGKCAYLETNKKWNTGERPHSAGWPRPHQGVSVVTVAATAAVAPSAATAIAPTAAPAIAPTAAPAISTIVATVPASATATAIATAATPAASCREGGRQEGGGTPWISVTGSRVYKGTMWQGAVWAGTRVQKGTVWQGAVWECEQCAVQCGTMPGSAKLMRCVKELDRESGAVRCDRQRAAECE